MERMKEMELKLYSSLQVRTTLVANEFIDRYMAGANGEYVKVYLYLLRHEAEQVTISMIADALEHTEADVRRALAYWEKLGILSGRSEAASAGKQETENKRAEKDKQSALEKGQPKRQETGQPQVLKTEEGHGTAGGESRKKAGSYDMRKLAEDEDFSQLLYIAQKYLNKVFTPRDCEVFGYLYGELHMSTELLEYLVEYCAQSGHTSIRYIETVALNWCERKLLTVEDAKTYSRSFTKDVFAVMKAFGLTDRKPGEVENDMISRWFKTYGFTREIIVEACNRTLAVTHNPSFQYADKILSEWKKAGVKSLSDVAVIDKKRQEQGKAKAAGTAVAGKAKSTNRFHNFEQNSYDYDEMVWSMIKEH